VTSSIDALRALWQDAERRLYPLATSSPHQYEHVVRLARAATNALTDVTTTEDLAAAWDGRAEIVARGLETAGVPIGAVREDDVAGLAFALRFSEVKMLELERAQGAVITAARDQDLAWVTLQERGTVDAGLMDPYQAVELHLGSGLALVSSVEPDLITGRANYVLAVIQLDPATGATIDMDPGIEPFVEVDTVEAHAAERDRLRAVIAARQ
jgi:hypothetical protein